MVAATVRPTSQSRTPGCVTMTVLTDPASSPTASPVPPSLPQHTNERDDAMARLLAKLSRALHPGGHHEAPVHFHAASESAEVCYDAACTRPHLSV